MAINLPYLPSYKNVGTLFEKIKAAGKPEVFTTRFLQETIGLKASGDRALIPLLKSMGLLDQGNKPTPAYSELKNPVLAKGALGKAIKLAYAPLFKANEKAHALDTDAIKGLIAQVTGADASIASKITGTYLALLKTGATFAEVDEEAPEQPSSDDADSSEQTQSRMAPTKSLRSEFHFNIQVHLPSNASEETYRNIFNALRRTFE